MLVSWNVCTDGRDGAEDERSLNGVGVEGPTVVVVVVVVGVVVSCPVPVVATCVVVLASVATYEDTVLSTNNPDNLDASDKPSTVITPLRFDSTNRTASLSAYALLLIERGAPNKR